MSAEIEHGAHPELAEAVRRLVDLFQPERIYLFGSHARGEASEDSDFDLLIVVPSSDEPHFQRARLAYSALAGIHLPVEVIVFTREQFERQRPVVASLAATVLREGQLIYGN